MASLSQAANLKLDIYNPGEAGIFPVSSEIISGDHEVVLIDAQFRKNDAQELVKMIQQTGKELTTIYISHSDPDFYFGLDVITEAFPKAKVIASPETI
ncbi:MBL fold metallo-hydrolase, partial [Xenorhabdus bovienii]|nr:MBL fold metallo-hydrolase [Xenorhabdus bovienii]